MNKNILNGQIGLLLLVIMGVVVALVMSVASRSLSDTVLSRQERESSAAFSVAETGVENAMNDLRQGTIPEGIINLDAAGIVGGSYKVAANNTYDLFVREGETAHLDLTTEPTLTISWTKKNDPTENITPSCSEGSGNAPAAIEISALNSTTAVRQYYNPSGCTPGAPGFLASADGGSTYRSTVASYSVPAGTTALRIKPLYSGATISVSGALGSQLYLINSTATGGDATKEIEVKRGLDAPPSVFDFAVFSAGTIVK